MIEPGQRRFVEHAATADANRRDWVEESPPNRMRVRRGSDLRDEVRLALPARSESKPEWDPVLVADRLALGLALARHRLTVPLARSSRRFLRGKDWFSFGYARLEDHARERFGRSGRWVRDHGALAEMIERIPALADALGGEDGGRPIGSVLALMIGRTASPDTCPEWIALARESTVRELREEIRKARDAGSAGPLRGCSGGRTRGAETLDEAGWGAEDRVRGSSSPNDPDEEERCTIRFEAPLPVKAAFEEARDLYNAVSGGQGALTGFIEALVADAFAGPAPPLDSDAPWRRPAPSARERLLESMSERWSYLRSLSDDRSVLAESERTLREVDRLCSEAGADAVDADGHIRALIQIEDEIQRRLGELLAEMGESGAWRGLCFAGVGHYGEERLGVSRTTAEERARLARALRERPVVREAHAEGRIGFETAALVLRALDGQRVEARYEIDWVEHAAETSVKRLRDEVRMLHRDGTTNPGRRITSPPDDATWRASLPRRPGDAIERVSRFSLEAAQEPTSVIVFGMRLPIGLAAELLAAVSARRRVAEARLRESRGRKSSIENHEPSAIGSTRTFSSGVATRVEVWGGSGGSHPIAVARTFSTRVTTDEPGEGCSGSDSETAARMFSTGPETGSRTRESCGGWEAVIVARIHAFQSGAGESAEPPPDLPCLLPEWAGLLGLIEDFVATWDDPRQSPRRASDRVYIRDGWRCSAPGCTSRQNLEDHHIVYRSRGGTDDLSNRTTLCRFHHQQGEHGDLLNCRGVAPLRIDWCLGRDGRGGRFRNERVAARAMGIERRQGANYPVGDLQFGTSVDHSAISADRLTPAVVADN